MMNTRLTAFLGILILVLGLFLTLAMLNRGTESPGNGNGQASSSATSVSSTSSSEDDTHGSLVTFTGVIVRMERPADDITYDYAIELDTPYPDPLNAYGEELTAQFPLYAESDIDLSPYLGDHVSLTGVLEWGYAESRIIHVEAIRVQ